MSTNDLDQILNHRKDFWNNFFNKYTQKLPDETELDIPLCSQSGEPFNTTDTGSLPYKTLMDIGEQSEYDLIEEAPSEYCIKSSYEENSFCSSVNTAAYILSHMNTTNKVDIVAIKEGTKRRILSYAQNICLQNMKITKSSNDEISSKTYGISDLQRDVTHEQSNSHSDTNRVKSPESCAKLMYSISDSRNRSSDIKQNLFNTQLLDSDQNQSIEKNFTLQDSPTILSRHKKLYIRRNSPIDLVHMKNSSNSSHSNKSRRISELKGNIHPALEPLYKRRKGYDVYEWRKIVCRRRFQISHFNETLSNLNVVKERETSYSLINANNTSTENNNQNMHKFASTIINNENEFNNSVKSSSTDATRELTNKTSVVSLQSGTNKSAKSNQPIMSLQNMNPIVRLKRLSRFDIQKYKNSNKAAINLENLNSLISRNLSNETNNNNLDYKRNINNALRVPINSCHHSHDISHSEKLETVYDNMVNNTHNDTNERIKHKSNRILLFDDDDDNDEFIKLIPKRHESFNSNIDACSNDTDLSCTTRKYELRHRRSASEEEGIETLSTNSSREKKKRSKRKLNINPLCFRTNIIASDSEESSSLSED